MGKKVILDFEFWKAFFVIKSRGKRKRRRKGEIGFIRKANKSLSLETASVKKFWL